MEERVGWRVRKRELESEKERCFIITMTGERVRETQGDEVRDGVRQWRVIERVRKTNRGGDRGKNEEKEKNASNRKENYKMASYFSIRKIS